ncbi:MAG: c-type cytochrome biogenesis protein CcmI [Alphaproteobacteria bacterium]
MGNIILWIAMAVLAAAATIFVLVPLVRTRGAAGTADDGSGERAIYRDQLRELARDTERGLIGAAEAEAARVEIARRLLHVEGATAHGPSRPGPLRWLVVSLMVVGPLAAIGLYTQLGSPDLPDQPRAARVAASADLADLPTLVARVEAHLADNVDDGPGWEVIAPIYVRLGRYGDAARAFAQANRLVGPTAQLEASIGESLVWENDGRVVEEARDAFRRAVALDPQQIRARFYLARAFEQDGDDESAVAAWRALLADAPPGALWAEDARAILASAEVRLDGGDATGGPSAADVAAAGDLAPEDRQAMIVSMVQRLAARLEDEPDDARGWVRLIRSYVVLDQPGEAASALQKARDALTSDAGGLALVDDVAVEFGLTKKSE